MNTVESKHLPFLKTLEIDNQITIGTCQGQDGDVSLFAGVHWDQFESLGNEWLILPFQDLDLDFNVFVISDQGSLTANKRAYDFMQWNADLTPELTAESVPIYLDYKAMMEIFFGRIYRLNDSETGRNRILIFRANNKQQTQMTMFEEYMGHYTNSKMETPCIRTMSQ